MWTIETNGLWRETSRVDRLIIIDTKSIPCDDKTLPPSPWMYRVNSNSLCEINIKKRFLMNDPGSHMRSPLDKRLPSPVVFFRVKKNEMGQTRSGQTQKHFEKKKKRYVY